MIKVYEEKLMNNKKFNRLTWHRKTTNRNHHPKYTKDVRKMMYEEGYWDKNDTVITLSTWLIMNKGKVIKCQD